MKMMMTMMLAITVIVIGSYAIDLFHMMINRGLKFVDNKFTYDPYSWVIETFPPIDDTLLVLVLVSHGGYLTGKLIPRSRSVGKGVSMKLGRAMQLSQKVGNLLRSFEQSLNIDNLLPRDRDHLQNLNINAKSLASKIEALPGRIGAGETVDDDLARLEGQIDALDTSYRSIVSSETLPIGANDATPEVVIEVQKQLKDRDYPVETTGILDDATRLAVEGFIKKQGLSKGDLHSEEYRRYEEILSLL